MTDINFTALDAELCRIPGVVATRFVCADPGHLSATIFVTTGTDVSRVLRDVAVVSGVHCRVRLEADRIVVMQVGHPAVIWPPAPPLSVPDAYGAARPAAAETPTTPPPAAAPLTHTPPAVAPPPVAVAAPPTTNGVRADHEAEEALASAQRTVAAMLEQLSSSASNP